MPSCSARQALWFSTYSGLADAEEAGGGGVTEEAGGGGVTEEAGGGGVTEEAGGGGGVTEEAGGGGRCLGRLPKPATRSP